MNKLSRQQNSLVNGYHEKGIPLKVKKKKEKEKKTRLAQFFFYLDELVFTTTYKAEY